MGAHTLSERMPNGVLRMYLDRGGCSLLCFRGSSCYAYDPFFSLIYIAEIIFFILLFLFFLISLKNKIYLQMYTNDMVCEHGHHPIKKLRNKVLKNDRGGNR